MGKAKLTVIAERADPDVVRLLEEHLANAKAGKVRSVAIATADKGGSIATQHIVWTKDIPTIYLAVEKLRHRILDTA